jgi:hypothetical protein
MSADQARPIYIAILGTDAVLAARPVDPVQLTRACQCAGFDFVAPVSWGEELLAMQVTERLTATNGNGSVVAAICPLVNAQLATTPFQAPVVRTVSPPVATARYLRAAFHPRRVHVTYVGACPGGSHEEIDVHCLPETLFTRLVESGIDVSRQPRHLDGQLPMERARYASVPGGVPEINWLMASTGRRVVDAAPITIDVVAQVHHHEPLLLDLAPACRCVCARDRTAAARLEPPRSPKPVVAALPAAVVDTPASATDETQGPEPSEPSTTEPAGETRATFAENALSNDEAIPLPPVANILSRVREPW